MSDMLRVVSRKSAGASDVHTKNYHTPGNLPPELSDEIQSPVLDLLQGREMENRDVDIQMLAQETIARMAHLDADLQCNLGGSILKDLRDRVNHADQQMIDRAFEVMGKFPHFARARAAVVMKALQSLAQ
jgi:hypothetical protein